MWRRGQRLVMAIFVIAVVGVGFDFTLRTLLGPFSVGHLLSLVPLLLLVLLWFFPTKADRIISAVSFLFLGAKNLLFGGTFLVKTALGFPPNNLDPASASLIVAGMLTIGAAYLPGGLLLLFSPSIRRFLSPFRDNPVEDRMYAISRDTY